MSSPPASPLGMEMSRQHPGLQDAPPPLHPLLGCVPLPEQPRRALPTRVAPTMAQTRNSAWEERLEPPCHPTQVWGNRAGSCVPL